MYHESKSTDKPKHIYLFLAGFQNDTLNQNYNHSRLKPVNAV